jgi:glutamate--cysteine ligase
MSSLEKLFLLKPSDLALAESFTPYLTGIKRGIEKESLRIKPDGRLSQSPHPHALGAALTCPSITTDYSEALPELITQASDDRYQPLKELKDIHRFIYQNLDDELLWAASMPCLMGGEKDIPIARYGSSNSGQMKEIYRVGLGLRYGRFMQAIAGVHYNFSLPDSFWQAFYAKENPELSLQDFISDKYMGLIRNFLRFSWIIPLFYGASPAVCESFFQGKSIDLGSLIPGTRYGKYSTSLRMSDFGYQNDAQSRLNMSYNSLPKYIAGLQSAISTPDPFYQKLGVKKDGEYQQLNDSILQIENEFYSNIRPKRVSVSGERPCRALGERGVEYIEVRALDINPFSSIGLDQSQISFLDSFLMACLFADSPSINARETGEYQENFRGVVHRGRHPCFCLKLNNRYVPLKQVAHQLLTQVRRYSEMLDKAYRTDEHVSTINTLIKQLNNLDETYSGRVVSNIEQRGDGFFPYALELSKQYKDEMLAEPLQGEELAFYQQQALDSHEKKKQIEQNDEISFEEFLARYYK